MPHSCVGLTCREQHLLVEMEVAKGVGVPYLPVLAIPHLSKNWYLFSCCSILFMYIITSEHFFKDAVKDFTKGVQIQDQATCKGRASVTNGKSNYFFYYSFCSPQSIAFSRILSCSEGRYYAFQLNTANTTASTITQTKINLILHHSTY